MTAHLSPYEYSGSVGRQQIRVLLIHPDKSLRTASGQQLPHFTLKVVSLAEEIEGLPSQDPNDPPVYYSALSYVWGDQSKLYQIAIDYALFEVGENLFAAIAHLLKNFPPPYWIDAICINQRNADEKEYRSFIWGKCIARPSASWCGLVQEMRNVGRLLLMSTRWGIGRWKRT